MKNRAQALSLLTELRGRLDELEQMICTAPDFVVASPALHGEPGVETLTPPDYLAFRHAVQDAGATPPHRLRPYEVFGNFIQFGAPKPGPKPDPKHDPQPGPQPGQKPGMGPAITASLESFALSDLHRAETETAQGLRLVPEGEPQPWFTYEFPTEITRLSDWEWVEWVLKLSFDAPLRLNPQVIFNHAGKTGRVSLPECRANTFATFLHFRLDRKDLPQPPNPVADNAADPVADNAAQQPEPPEQPVQIRLVLGTNGGQMIPLTLYQFSLYGKRINLKGDRSDPKL